MKRMFYPFGGLLFCILFSFPVHTQTPANSSGTITGRVVTADGQPLPDVHVTLYVQGPNGGPRSTASDDEGQFSFSDLAAGQYTLNALAPGYVMQRLPAVRPGGTATLTLVKGGVITGRVTNALGEPVVAVSVSAQLIRETSGRRVPENVGLYSQPTDDRGLYRLYGLREGTYLVLANAPERYASPVSAYQNETPTYHPAADRDGAQEIVVKLGDEASGIDIRYRGERGYQLSGKITGAVAVANPAQSGINLTLKRIGSEASYTATLRASGGETEFSFFAVAEGEYELSARQYENPLGYLAQAVLRRVRVKGADVAKVMLTLAPLGSLAGRAVLDAPAPELKCAGASPLVFEEVSVGMRRGKPASVQGEPLAIAVRPNASGEFVMRGLSAEAYFPFFSARSDHWYLRAMSLTKTALPARNVSPALVDLSRSGVTLKPGENLTGLTLAFAPGAAAVQGRVISGAGGTLPEALRVYLIPAEPGAADEVLRYAELLVNTLTNKNGLFGFSRLAPGRYRLYAEAVPLAELDERRDRLAAAESAARVRLRRLAAVQPELELKACDRVQDYELRLAVSQ